MKDQTPVAVTSRSFSRHRVLRSELLERYERVTFNERGESLAGDILVRFLKGHTKAITALERIDESVLAAVPELRVISKYGVGLDTLDLDAMARHGVALGWTAGVNRRSVAELTIAFAIDLLHRVPAASADVRSGRWTQLVGRHLTGRAVGLIGCGHVGKEAARLFRAFDCRVMVYDIRDYPEFFAAYQIVPTGLNELLRDADVVSLHVPLDDSTRGLLGAEQLEQMKPGAVLINTARGGLIDERALGRLLRNGRLAGAALDVFAAEPPNDGELVALPNVIVTPHLGGSTEEAILAMGRAAIAGLEDAIEPSPASFPQAFVSSR